MTEAERATPPVVVTQESLRDETFSKAHWEGRQTDWLLQWLVRSSNRASMTIGITLSIGGSIVSGNLISHSDYFAQLADAFSKPFEKIEGWDAQEIKSIILGFDAQPNPDETEEDEVPFQYLHLANARTYFGTSATVPAAPGALWRGKIAAVDGFTLGRIS